MKDKKYFNLTIGIVAVVIICIAIVMVYLDPFFHYHKPLEFVSYSIYNESYQNPGIVRNFDYDSILCGSSMVELLQPSQIDQAFGTHTIKVPYSGGTSKNMNIILNQAFTYHPDIEYVFYGLDWYALNTEKEEVKMELPDYLYDANPFTDLSYLLNKTVLLEDVPNLFDSSVKKDTNFDDAYNWKEEHEFYKNAVLSQASTITDDIAEASQASELHENVVANLQENILPLVQNHPDTKFVFFIPPYSIMNWYPAYMAGTMPDVIYNIDYVVTELLKCENTEIFFFPGMQDTTSNLYLYMDLMHYSPKVAEDVVTCLYTGEYRMKTSNKKQMLKEFESFIDDFDYSIYTEKGAPCQVTEGLNEYLQLISNDKYIVFITVNSSVGTLEEKEIDILKKYGYLSDEYNTGEYAVRLVDGTDMIYEKYDTSPILGEQEYEDLIFAFCTADETGTVSMMLNDVEYCVEARPLNIIVYDKELKRVVDSSGLRTDTRILTKY